MERVHRPRIGDTLADQMRASSRPMSKVHLEIDTLSFSGFERNFDDRMIATLLIHPAWPHARNFGYAPFLVSAALTCVCVLILFFGPERRSRFRSASDS